MTPYRNFRYITPPRTEVRLDPTMLRRYEGEGNVAQVKRNGTRSVIFVPPSGDIFAWNRHGEPHKAWGLPNGRRARGVFSIENAMLLRQCLPAGSWNVVDSELLHSKTKSIKNIHYLYDILVYKGQHLTGTTYRERYDRLLDIFIGGAGEVVTHFGHYELDPHTWLSRNYTENFLPLFNSLTAPEDEGLVIKSLDGIYRGDNANDWMRKILKRKVV
jgi:ATP dependent DNA ligase-like protein